MKDKIIIIGAAGAVGSKIAMHLAKDNKIVLSGRTKNTLNMVAQSINNETEVLLIDINNIKDYSFLKTAKTLIVCVDIEHTHLLDACIKHKVDYVDISASEKVFEILRSRQQMAVQNGVRLLFGLGLAPGLTNLLAYHLLQQMPDAINMKLFILLGLGEAHGDQAYKWTFDNLHKQFTIRQQNKAKDVLSFTQAAQIDLLGKRNFYLFDFVDQHILSQVSAVPSISSRLAFDSKWFTAMVALMRKLGLTKIYSNKKVQNIMMSLLKKIKLGTDVYGLKVVLNNEAGSIIAANINGFNEGAITAMVAAKAIAFLSQYDKVGLLYAQDVIKDVSLFLEDLKQSELSFDYHFS